MLFLKSPFSIQSMKLYIPSLMGSWLAKFIFAPHVQCTCFYFMGILLFVCLAQSMIVLQKLALVVLSGRASTSHVFHDIRELSSASNANPHAVFLRRSC